MQLQGEAPEDEALGLLQDFDQLRSFRFIQSSGIPRHVDDAYALQRQFKAPASRVERPLASRSAAQVEGASNTRH